MYIPPSHERIMYESDQANGMEDMADVQKTIQSAHAERPHQHDRDPKHSMYQKASWHQIRHPHTYHTTDGPQYPLFRSTTFTNLSPFNLLSRFISNT